MEVVKYNDMQIVRAEGEIDHWIAPDLEQKIDEVLAQGMKNVIIDFTNLTYIDSGGVAVLFSKLKIIAEQGGKLIVVTANKNIIKILELVNIHKQDAFFLVSNLDEAKSIN